MALTGLKEDLESLLALCKCLICKKTVKEPVSTKCGHQFCRPCIFQVIDQDKKSAECPSCKKVILKKGLVFNTDISLLIHHFNNLLLAFQQELKITAKIPFTPPVAKKKVEKKSASKNEVTKTEKLKTSSVPKRSETVSTPARRERSSRQSAIIANLTMKFQNDTPSTDYSNNTTEFLNTCPSKLLPVQNKNETPQKSGTIANNVTNSSTDNIPALIDSSSVGNKVTTWLENAETDAIPTQDPATVLSSPATQSPLLSVSQNQKNVKEKRIPVYSRARKSFNAPKKVNASEKGPFDFSQTDSETVIVKLCPETKVVPPRQYGRKRATEIATSSTKKLNQPTNVRPLRRSSSLKINETSAGNSMESEHLEQVEAPRDVSEMLLFQSQSEKYQKEKEEKRLKEIESFNVAECSTSRKRKRIESKKPVVVFTKGKHEDKIRQQIEEAETFDLVIENSKKKSRAVDKTVVLGTKSSIKQKSSAATKTTDASVTQTKVAFNVNRDEAEFLSDIISSPSPKNKKIMTPGLPTRRSTISRKCSVTVEPNVNKTSVSSRQAKLTVSSSLIVPETQSDELSNKMDSSLLSPKSDKSEKDRKSEDQFNTSSCSSLGKPDLERVALMENIVQQVENGTLNISDLSVPSVGNESQLSVSLIENSLPSENELTRNKTQIDADICSPDVIIAQPSTQMSLSNVHLLEKLHDLTPVSTQPKRKTFSLESDTEDLAAEMEPGISTQEQFMGLASAPIGSKKNTTMQEVQATKTQGPVVKFIKLGSLRQQNERIVRFIQLGYLSPNLRRKRFQKVSASRCDFGCMKLFTTLQNQPKLQTTGVQTCPDQVSTCNKLIQTCRILSQDPFDETKLISQQTITLPEPISLSVLKPNQDPVSELGATLHVNDENLDEEFEDELTIIEKSQEINVKKTVTAKNKNDNNNVMEVIKDTSDDECTISSGDVIQASISQPVRSSQIQRSLFYSSPITSSCKQPSPLTSLHESDGEGNSNLGKSKNKSRKRGGCTDPCSDSDSDVPENKIPNKKPLCLSMKKNALKKTRVSPTTSDLEIAATVQADLEYARTVGPFLPRLLMSDDSVPSTINLDSPVVTAYEVLSSGSEHNVMKNGIESPVQMEIDTAPADTLHEGTYCDLSDNPFFDKNALIFSPSQQNTINLYGNSLAHQPPITPKLTSTTPVKTENTPDRKQANICKDSDDSDSEILIESTPKRNRNVSRQVIATPPPVPVNQPTRPIRIAWSGLQNEEINYAYRFSNKFNIHASGVFSDDITHLVISFNVEKLATNTYKFFLAVAKGVWIVSTHWLKDSLEAGIILPEDKYEMYDSEGTEGPKNSRLSSVRLFRDFEFFCADADDSYTELNKNQLKTIITFAGGQVIDESQLQNPCSRKYRLILIPEDVIPKELTECRTTILNVSWVVDSVEQFKLLSVNNFYYRSIDEELLMKADFPSEMLEALGDDSASMTTNTTVNMTVTQPSLYM